MKNILIACLCLIVTCIGCSYLVEIEYQLIQGTPIFKIKYRGLDEKVSVSSIKIKRSTDQFLVWDIFYEPKVVIEQEQGKVLANKTFKEVNEIVFGEVPTNFKQNYPDPDTIPLLEANRSYDVTVFAEKGIGVLTFQYSLGK